MSEIRITEALTQWRTWSSGSIDELAAIGTAFVWSLGLEPLPEITASAQMNRRTIRYYISSDLVDPPEGDRRLAIYHYRHLLQVLYIKARQHAGDRLNEIRQDLAGRADGSLEQLVIDTLPESVTAPVPVDPKEFARPADLNAVLQRWAYLTGRTGRYRATSRTDTEQTIDQVDPTDQSDNCQLSLRMEIDLGDGISLTMPADHPLVQDEDGRGLILRGIRRLLRDYQHGGGPAGEET